MSDIAARQILREAADIVETHGLAKERYFRAAGVDKYDAPEAIAGYLKDSGSDFKCCTLGAIYMASLNHKQEGSRDRAIERFWQALDLGDDYGIVDWNDRPSRTKHQVVKALREAAERTEV